MPSTMCRSRIRSSFTWSVQRIRPRASGRSPQRLRGRLRRSAGFRENELVASKRAALSVKFFEHESALPVEVEDRFRFRNFERIAADPVNGVRPSRHPPFVPPIPPALKGTQTDEILQPATPPTHNANRKHQHEPQWFGRLVIEPLYDCPTAADLTLIVVNCDKQFPVIRDQPGSIIESLPHIACVMKHSPRVDHIKGSER